MRILGTVASSSREVPNAPTIGTATNVGTGRAYNNGSATVTFTAPTYDGGLPITTYTATSSPGGFTASGASSPLTVTGLQSAIAYTFTVTATNSRGTGAASAASNSITATTVPQAPTIGTATDGGTGTTVTVAYTAGATGGAAVSTFTATSSPGSLTGTGASPITVSGLTAGTAYTFTVTATNANGTSTASAASNSVTPAIPSYYESIATVTGTGSAASLTFSSIPSTYKSLQIRGISKDTYTTSATGDFIKLTFNSDTGANYSASSAIGNGTTTLNRLEFGGSYIYIANASMTSGTGLTNITGGLIIDIIDYTSSSKNKTINAFAGGNANSTSTNYRVTLTSGLWVNTNAITSITITCGSTAFTTSSSFALYGIKG